ncbi:MAG: hypothetical protein NTY33_00860 [Candidatus Moranbacteria bacterium]|nr:hypothetical protein [Candidatus Moranbacteria bacterium]
MYTQEPLLRLMETGKVFGETEKLKRHIETVISNVFIFPKHAYKVYKNDNAFFNNNFRDISERKTRFDFTRRDFEWNYKLNSSIYVALKPMAVINGELCVVDAEMADENVIVMNTFPEESVFINIFKHGVLENFDAYRGGQSFAELRGKLPKLSGNHLDSLAVSLELCNDIYKWTLVQKNKFEIGEVEIFDNLLKKLVTKDQSVREYFHNHLSASMDIHMGNALYYEGKLMLIDTFSPKESWFIKHECCDLYRLGTDIRVFMGGEAWELFKSGYYSISLEKPCPPAMDIFSTIYASLIMVSYLFNLGGEHIEQAKKHQSFLRNYIKSLK